VRYVTTYKVLNIKEGILTYRRYMSTYNSNIVLHVAMYVLTILMTGRIVQQKILQNKQFSLSHEL